MTITPTFHFVCRFCGSLFEATGYKISDAGTFSLECELMESEQYALCKAKCLEDTCRQCMPIHAKANQDHDDMKASRCPIEEPDL